MGLVKPLILQGMSNKQIEEQIRDQFAGCSPAWLRQRICNYRSQIKTNKYKPYKQACSRCGGNGYEP